MVIEAQLSTEQFSRLVLLRHFQRGSFYFYALTAAGLTSYVLLFGGPVLLLMLAWLPFGLYIILGLLNAYLGTRGGDQPYLLPTRYEFVAEGISIKHEQGEGHLNWEHLRGWRKQLDCYVIELKAGQIVAFPAEAVPKHRAEDLERLLDRHIKAEVPENQ
jgi:hypothetical protein